MKLRDRIKRFDRLYARDLAPNPRNWRTHPTQQIEALKGILAEIGFAGAILCRETPDGLEIIDGHARAEIADDQLVPVLVLDVSEEEANKLLATFDPIGAMAEINKEALADLLDSISVKNESLHKMLEGMRLQHGLMLDQGKEYDETIANEVEMVTCPHCGKEFPK